MALVVVSLVRDHGLHYQLAATVLTGVLEIAVGTNPPLWLGFRTRTARIPTPGSRRDGRRSRRIRHFRR